MTPAEQLAAARQNVVGPYLPAREEWLRGWAGSVMWRVSPNTDVLETAIATGFVFNGRAELRLTSGTTMQRPDRIRLDTRLPEVRDHLVRLGCPEWARDVPAAGLAWGMGVSVVRALLAWQPLNGSPDNAHYRPTTNNEWAATVGPEGWCLDLPRPARRMRGPETGDEGRARADLVALRAGCILRVEGGWLVPLLGGGIGFFEEVSRDE